MDPDFKMILFICQFFIVYFALINKFFLKKIIFIVLNIFCFLSGRLRSSSFIVMNVGFVGKQQLSMVIQFYFFFFYPKVKIIVFLEERGSELCFTFSELVAVITSFIAKSVVCILLPFVLCD